MERSPRLSARISVFVSAWLPAGRSSRGYASDSRDINNMWKSAWGRTSVHRMLRGHFTTFSRVLLAVQRRAANVLILDLQPTLTLDYEHTDTQEWLANCCACCVPEISNAFARVRAPFDVVAGMLFENGRAWGEIRDWITTAGVRSSLYYARRRQSRRAAHCAGPQRPRLGAVSRQARVRYIGRIQRTDRPHHHLGRHSNRWQPKGRHPWLALYIGSTKSHLRFAYSQVRGSLV